MKKRLIAILLALCLCVGALPVAALAAVPEASALQAVQVLEILPADADQNAAVTRAEFAQMLVRASQYKDGAQAGGVGGTLFTDVQGGTLEAEYIRIAVRQGWMSGYSDGSFRPENTVTLEEACTAVLKLLGYDTTSLSGPYPSAQLSKANELGLCKKLDRAPGEAMTNADCTQLFYNALLAKDSSDRTYAVSLGYTVTDAGALSVTAAIRDKLEGPFVATGNDTLPFTPSTVYRNDRTTRAADLKQYDVYYYDTASATLWIYNNSVVGYIDAVSPSTSSPTSVTMWDTQYTVGTTTAAYQLSALAGSGEDRMVTLLLGMDDAVVAVEPGYEAWASSGLSNLGNNVGRLADKVVRTGVKYAVEYAADEVKDKLPEFLQGD